MAERTIIMGGKPKTLSGRELKVGDLAPDIELVGPDLAPVRLSSLRGKVVIVSTVTSLDTSVCDSETHRFNDEVTKFGDDVAVLTVSADLPYAMRRWATENAIDNVVLASDHRATAFGQAYGVLVEDLRLLARAVFVVDREGTIRYIQIRPNNGEEPDYDEVFEAVKALL